MIPVIEKKRVLLQDLCRRYGVRRLELFGSAATQSFDPARSDLDFLVEFLPEQSLGPWLRHYFALQAELADLFGRPSIWCCRLQYGTAISRAKWSAREPSCMGPKTPKLPDDIRDAAAFIRQVTHG